MYLGEEDNSMFITHDDHLNTSEKPIPDFVSNLIFSNSKGLANVGCEQYSRCTQGLYQLYPIVHVETV